MWMLMSPRMAGMVVERQTSRQVPRSSVNEAEWQGSVSGNKAEWWAAKSDDVHFEGARALEEEKEMTGKKQRGAKRTPTSLPDPSCL